MSKLLKDLKQELYELRYKLAGATETIDTLNTKLAEKEKEIERLKELNIDIPIKQMQFHHNQDKISFAVEKLKFLKNEIEMMGHIPNYTVLPERELISRSDVFRLIDNQIAELKKEIK